MKSNIFFGVMFGCLVSGTVAIWSIVDAYKGGEEIDNHLYRDISNDLLSDSDQPVYHDACLYMHKRVKECFSDGKITVREYNTLYNERVKFIITGNDREAKEQLTKALNSPTGAE